MPTLILFMGTENKVHKAFFFAEEISYYQFICNYFFANLFSAELGHQVSESLK